MSKSRCVSFVVFIFGVFLTTKVSYALNKASVTYNPLNKTAAEVPEEMKNVDIKEHLGERVDLNLNFTDDEGQLVKLGHYFDGVHPVLLSLVYYNCPNLCNLHLNGVKDMLKKLEWTLGQQFRMVVVTIDPKENVSLAKEKKAKYVESYGRPEGAQGWHFLTMAPNQEEDLKKLAQQVGFAYKWDPVGLQWSHPAVGYVLTPKGFISRYLYGIQFDPQLVRLSLVEASESKIGTVLDRLVLFCLHYNPEKGTYSFYIFNLMRLAAGLTLVLLVSYLLSTWYKYRFKKEDLDTARVVH